MMNDNEDSEEDRDWDARAAYRRPCEWTCEGKSLDDTTTVHILFQNEGQLDEEIQDCENEGFEERVSVV